MKPEDEIKMLKKGIVNSFRDNGWFKEDQSDQDIIDYIIDYADDFYPDLEDGVDHES